MSQSPYELPPGPERRQLMQRLGWNVGAADFSEEEIAASKAEAKQLEKVVDQIRAAKAKD